MPVRDDLIPKLSTRNFIILFVGTLGLVFIAVLTFALLADGRHLDGHIPEAAAYVLQDYIYAGLILFGVYVFGLKISRLDWSDVGFVRCSGDWIVRAFLAGTMLYALRTFLDVFGLTILGERRMVEPGLTDRAILNEASLLTTIGFVVVAAVVTPFATEIFQRGILFAWLRRNFNFFLSAIASAVIFGVLHIQLTRYAQALVFGLVAAYLYEKSRSLWPSIALHVTLNCAYLVSIMT